MPKFKRRGVNLIDTVSLGKLRNENEMCVFTIFIQYIFIEKDRTFLILLY